MIRFLEYGEVEFSILEESSDSGEIEIYLNEGSLYTKTGKSGDFRIITPTTALGVRGTAFMVSEGIDGVDYLAGIFMKEGSAEVDVTGVRNCLIDINLKVIKLQRVCEKDEETVILNAGEQILFYEKDYVISSLQKDLGLINSFRILDFPSFHSIRREYYDLGDYDPVEYQGVHFQTMDKDGRINKNYYPGCNYQYYYNRCLNRCCYRCCCY